MIVYRCLRSNEILSMINNQEFNNKHVRMGKNTFHYEKNVKYKHFFVYAAHARFYKEQISAPVIGEFIIPNEIIDQQGYGFYSEVETMRNDRLYHWYMPLPEIIIKEKDFKKEYLYKVNDWFHNNKLLDNNDNEKYNEPTEIYSNGEIYSHSYTDYSYPDIYYEMVYQLFKSHNMDEDEVVKILLKMNLHTDVIKYYEENKSFFEEQTKQYIKKNKIS